MYLHIGKSCVIDEKKIIGIFDINSIKKEFEEYNKNLKNKLIDISDGTPKTIVLIDDVEIKGYITNISSTTLRKRDI